MLRPTPPASIWLTRTRAVAAAVKSSTRACRLVGGTLPVRGPIATPPTLRSFAVASSTMSTSRARHLGESRNDLHCRRRCRGDAWGDRGLARGPCERRCRTGCEGRSGARVSSRKSSWSSTSTKAKVRAVVVRAVVVGPLSPAGLSGVFPAAGVTLHVNLTSGRQDSASIPMLEPNELLLAAGTLDTSTSCSDSRAMTGLRPWATMRRRQ